ncbi:hypothetical protein BKA66DRAFT_568043 [Pyrenochaeta sp. MPI-SDFR-AT-0127]|nr:hypothetical protein BKA66DRAFT_568043 [Pyrenochaeta sp. MPI-SDFR-AT-0127]
MAGRILPIALAAVAGISIGVATFDGEFKEQRKKRLEEEYKRELAALSSPNIAGSSVMVSSATTSTSLEPPTTKEENRTLTASESSWSSMLGLWAWGTNTKEGPVSSTGTGTPPKNSIDEVKGKP